MSQFGNEGRCNGCGEIKIIAKSIESESSPSFESYFCRECSERQLKKKCTINKHDCHKWELITTRIDLFSLLWYLISNQSSSVLTKQSPAYLM